MPIAPELFRNIKDRPYSFILDSSWVDGRLGRWSFLGSDPFLVFKSKRGSIHLQWKDGRAQSFRANPFAVLKDIFSSFKTPRRQTEIPFVSGGVGYFAYDLKDSIEDSNDKAADDLNLPDCVMGFYDTVVAVDNLKEGVYSSGSDLKHSPYSSWGLGSNFTKESYMRMIKRAKRCIKKGDIYQVNLSHRFEAAFEGDPFELYSNLRVISPAPFSSYLNFGDAVILSSSPERF